MRRIRVRQPAFDRLESRHCRARAPVIVLDHATHLAEPVAEIAEEAVAASLRVEVDAAELLAPGAEEAAPARVRPAPRLRKAAADTAETPRTTAGRRESPELILPASLSSDAHLHDAALTILIDRNPTAGATGPRASGGLHGSSSRHEVQFTAHGAAGASHVPQSGVPIKLMASTMFHRRSADEPTVEDLLLDAAGTAHDEADSLEPALEPSLEPELEPMLEPDGPASESSPPHEAMEVRLAPVRVAAIVVGRDGLALKDAGTLRVVYLEPTPIEPAETGWLLWLAAQLRALVAWIAA